MSYINLSQIGFGDTQSVDAFGRLRVSSPTTLFDSQQEYGLDTLRLWDAAANGTLSTGATNGSVTNGSNAVGPRDSNTRMVPVTCSTTNGHYSILQSRQYTRYIPGASQLVFVTGVLAAGANAAASIVRRSSTSGSVVDTAVAQASWNIDKFDGSGPSGVTLDFTKTQILFISAQWLGVGRVITGFDVDGLLCPAHQFLNANNLTVPYTQTFNLPVRMEIRNTGASTCVARTGYFDSANGIFLETSRATAGGTVYFNCASVKSEGGDEARGFPNSTPSGISTIALTTRRPVLSIRPKSTYNSVTNRAHIQDLEYLIRATTNDSLVEVVIGGTLTGASWTSVGAASITEYDVSSTAISGGTTLIQGFAISGSGSTALTDREGVDIRSPLVLSQIDALTANQIPVSLVCTSFSGTSNVTSLMNWHEQVV